MSGSEREDQPMSDVPAQGATGNGGLKPCPLCRCPAKTSGDPKDKFEPGINIHCTECGCEGGWFHGKDCEERAAKHWNSRPDAVHAEGKAVSEEMSTLIADIEADRVALVRWVPGGVIPLAKEPMLLALKRYADQYCEGWCKDAVTNANFDDCGGCRAQLALAAPQSPAGNELHALATAGGSSQPDSADQTTITMGMLIEDNRKLRAQVESATELGRAAAYCIARLSDAFKGNSVRDLDEAEEAYRSALQKFQASFSLPSTELPSGGDK